MEIHRVPTLCAASLARRHESNRFHCITPSTTTKAANLAASGRRLAGDRFGFTRKADGRPPGFTASFPGLPGFFLDDKSEPAPRIWDWKGVSQPAQD